MAPPTSANPDGRLADLSYEHTNDRESRYSGVGAVGMGFLTGDADDDDDDDDEYDPKYGAAARPPPPPGIPSALTPARLAPTQVKPLDVQKPAPTSIQVPQPDEKQYLRKPSEALPAALSPGAGVRSRFAPKAPVPQAIAIPQPTTPPLASPMSPHPLQAPKTPIKPAFAGPTQTIQPTIIKFSEDAILRGNKEETLLSRNTPKGAEFWRRFSVIVKEPSGEGEGHRSSWLTKDQSRSSRMSACIWIASIVILLAIGAGVGFGWYLTHDNPSSVPKALGGSANQTSGVASSTAPLTMSSAEALHTVTGDLPPTTTPAVSTATPAVKRRSRHTRSNKVVSRRTG